MIIYYCLERLYLDKIKKLFTGLVIAALLMIPCFSAFAGGINGAEQSIISAASGTFTYNGVQYVATAGALDYLRGYLALDEIDLTGAQAQKAISYMYSNVKTGVDMGYIVPVNASKKEKNNKDAGDDVLNWFIKDTETAPKERVDEDGILIKAAPVFKNTGISSSFALAGVFVLVTAVIGYILLTRQDRKTLVAFILSLSLLLFFSADEFYAKYQGAAVNELAQKGNITGYVSSKKNIKAGVCFGSIEAKEPKLKAPLIYGDSMSIFDRGAGVNTRFSLPGEKKTIIVGGHDKSFFKNLDMFEKGDEVVVETGYGKYTYEMYAKKVAKYNDDTLLKKVKGETLVLYTCYPLNSKAKNRKERYITYFRLTDIQKAGAADE